MPLSLSAGGIPRHSPLSLPEWARGEGDLPGESRRGRRQGRSGRGFWGGRRGKAELRVGGVLERWLGVRSPDVISALGSGGRSHRLRGPVHRLTIRGVRRASTSISSRLLAVPNDPDAAAQAEGRCFGHGTTRSEVPADTWVPGPHSCHRRACVASAGAIGHAAHSRRRPQVQEGPDAAAVGGTFLVENGTCYENRDMGLEALHRISVSGDSGTIYDGSSLGRVLKCRPAEALSVLRFGMGWIRETEAGSRRWGEET